MLLTTTTGTLLLPPDGDPYEAAEPVEVATGLPCHISQPSGNEIDEGGQLERVDAVLLCDPSLGITHLHLWRDDGTDQTYRVAWVRERQGLGLDHTKAGLVAYQGGANGG